MKGLYYREFGGKISLENLADPKAPPDGVVIAVAASGLCLSDWHGWIGHDKDIRLPHVPGHELAGTIVEVGQEVKNWTVGQRVTVPFVGGCGSCVYCKEGNPQVCDHQFQPGFTAWGSFAEYVAIRYADENLVLLPDSLDFVSAASLGCRFVTAYRAVVDQGRLQENEWVAIHGCGGVGLSAILIAKALGAKVIAVDIFEDTCQLAKELGADYTVNALKTPVVEAIQEYSRGGVHISIDALGKAETCLNSIASLRKGGKHLQLGLLPGGPVAIPMDRVIANELQIIGSHGIQAHRYPAMFDLISTSGIDLSRLIHETIDLRKAGELLPVLNKQRAAGIRVLVFD